MEIKQSEIGNTYTVNFNMMVHTVTISDDPAKFKYYQTLSLDVFEEKKSRKKAVKKQDIQEEEE